MKEGGATASGLFYGATDFQLSLINLIALHQEGFTGEGIVIGVLDTGFKRTHAAFNLVGDPIDIVAEHDFVNDDPDTSPEAGDLGSRVAASTD